MVPRTLLSLLLVLANLSLVLAQQPPPPPPQNPANQTQSRPEIDSQDVVKITTNLVQLDAVVTKDGKQVTDLTAADFELLEDGKPQTITNFSYISVVAPASSAPVKPVTKDKNAPPVPPAIVRREDVRRTVAIMVDDLGMSFSSVSDVRRQLRKYIDEELSPNDLVAIIRTGGDVGALQQFTNDKRVLTTAVDHIRWNPCSRVGVHVFNPAGAPPLREATGYGVCGQEPHDSIRASLRIFDFVLDGMKFLPGRKSMVVLSDDLPISTRMAGEEPFGRDSPISLVAAFNKVTEKAIRSAVVIYAADTRGLQYTGPTAADQVTFPSRSVAQPDSILARMRNARTSAMFNGRQGADLLSQETGGFLNMNSNDYGLKKVMTDQQGYYLIGFRPADETFDRRFHALKVRVKQSGLTVRTRSGFYGFTDDQVRAVRLTPDDAINHALLSPVSAQEINVRLTSFFIDDPKDGPLVRSLLYFDPHDVTFTERDGWQVTNLKIKTMVFGDNGKPIAEEERTGNIRFRGEGYQRALREGVTYTLDFPLSVKGPFQIRVAVRDDETSKIGSAGQFVELPNLGNGRLLMSGIVARAATNNDSPEPVASGPAVRQFHQGSTIKLAYSIYNAAVQQRKPELNAQIRLFRDGLNVFTGESLPVDLTAQTDLQRLTNVLKFNLGSQLSLGNYVCQIIVTDSSDKQNPRVASQWIDFEIVK